MHNQSEDGTVMESLLTVRDAAVVLRLPRGRVYELCRSGVIPHVRLCRQIRIDPVRLRSFLDGGGRSFPGTVNRGTEGGLDSL